jgi:glycosyltransferase involved in cell wall biosynthesis
MRVAVLWSCLSGYFVNCLAELASRGVELLVFHYPTATSAPFAFRGSDLPGDRYLRTEMRSVRHLLEVVRRFDPHMALISGWMDPWYLLIARSLRRKGCVVVGAMDNQWRAAAKQVIAARLLGWTLRRVFSVLWVPGERAEQYARRLGFRGSRLWRGLYCGATDQLRAVAQARARLGRDGWPRRFVFVGRYETVKGLSELLEAYGNYRSISSDPWELWCAGHGPLKRTVAAQKGVRDLGFVQPDDLPSVLAQCGCFVLPSRREGWVVALLEAAASGLPIICSDECGSHVELVREGYNRGALRVRTPKCTVSRGLLPRKVGDVFA